MCTCVVEVIGRETSPIDSLLRGTEKKHLNSSLFLQQVAEIGSVHRQLDHEFLGLSLTMLPPLVLVPLHYRALQDFFLSFLKITFYHFYLCGCLCVYVHKHVDA